MLDMFFYLHRKELVIIGGSTLFIAVTCFLIYWIGRRWLTRYNVQKNIRRIEFYMSGGDKSSDLCCELGNNYMYINDFENAEKWFREALDVDTDNMEAYLSLAELYKKSQEYDKLRDIYYRLSELNPYDYDILRELGWAYYYCEDFESAINTFLLVKRMAPGDIHTRYSLGLLYLNQNDKIKAIQEYRELKKLDDQKADELFDYIYPEDQGITMESGGLGDDDGEEHITLKQSMEEDARMQNNQQKVQETSAQRRRVRTPAQSPVSRITPSPKTPAPRRKQTSSPTVTNKQSQPSSKKASNKEVES
ncbi:MAG: tetratricopeptide repeat protein [Candidatus Auribacterota bacterium]|jgi:tetratricopeptide (TPR) repeat protein|nr:tetratricopeptide repeat protein [Candidatus Auribacterota bacterium]